MEDLWAFNEERVARAIAASRIPVISAVGHEVDFTIADFVADLRAPTPSAAAEMVVKSRLELESHVDHLLLRLEARMRAMLHVFEIRAEGLQRRLRSPKQELDRLRERYESLSGRLRQCGLVMLRDRGNALSILCARLEALSPLRVLGRGYAIAFTDPGGAVISSSRSLTPGEPVRIQLAEGGFRALVEEIDP